VVGVDKKGFYSSACGSLVKAAANIVCIHLRSFRGLFLIVPLPLVHSVIHRRSQSILETRRPWYRRRCWCRFWCLLRCLLRCALTRTWCAHYRLSLEVIRIHLIPVYLVHFWFGTCFGRRNGFDWGSSSLRILSKSPACTRWIGFLGGCGGDVEFILPFEKLAFLRIISIERACVECSIHQHVTSIGMSITYLPGFFEALPATNLEHTRLCPYMSILVNVPSKSAHSALDHAIFVHDT